MTTRFEIFLDDERMKRLVEILDAAGTESDHFLAWAVDRGLNMAPTSYVIVQQKRRRATAPPVMSRAPGLPRKAYESELTGTPRKAYESELTKRRHEQQDDPIAQRALEILADQKPDDED